MIGLDKESLENYYKSLAIERETDDFQSVYEKKQPLVSVLISTYNRSEILINRSLKSILNQTYKNLEIIVVGDNCTDDTEVSISKINDSRLIFKNRSERGPYGDRVGKRLWMVAGSYPMNDAISMATGDFYTQLDDDDEHSPDRVEKMVGYAKQYRPDYIFHSFLHEVSKNNWCENISTSGMLECGRVTTSSHFSHKFFLKLPWDANAEVAGDWDRCEKIIKCGPRILYVRDSSLLKHYAENQNKI